VTDTFRADGVRALITGGTSGLGAAMASALLDAGATVAVTGRDPERARAAAQGLGPKAVGIGLDVRNEADVARGVDDAVEALGGLDVLVNNAGVYPVLPFEETTFAQWRQVMAVNLDGTFLVTRAALPALRRSTAGRIVTIATPPRRLG
jgi:NAD(P)-dependent dehydrogenase (short-subunit alcohol dehydrogenase family)